MINLNNYSVKMKFANPLRHQIGTIITNARADHKIVIKVIVNACRSGKFG